MSGWSNLHDITFLDLSVQLLDPWVPDIGSYSNRLLASQESEELATKILAAVKDGLGKDWANNSWHAKQESE